MHAVPSSQLSGLADDTIQDEAYGDHTFERGHVHLSSRWHGLPFTRHQPRPQTRTPYARTPFNTSGTAAPPPPSSTESLLAGESTGEKAFPCEARPLCTPEERAALPPLKENNTAAAADDGDEEEEEGGGTGGLKTARELARLCYEDPCDGFMEVSKSSIRGRGRRLCFTG